MTGRWPAVARTDFANISRSYLVRGIVGVFVLLVVGIVTLPGLVSDFASAEGVFQFTTQASATVVPITALIAGYLSIAGERQSGSIRVLLSLPPSRRDVFVGKFLSRSGVVLVGILLAFALAAVGSQLVYGSLPAETVVVTTLLTAALGVTFAAIAVAISAATASRSRAVAASIAFFLVTVVLWRPLMFALRFLLGELQTRGPPPDWIQFLTVFPPSQTFARLTTSLVGSLLSQGSPPGDAVYLSDPALGLVMVGWLIVPLVLGYWLFARADLS
ncbi:MAG: ABC transporter permease subunit [Salinirussus sp.]